MNETRFFIGTLAERTGLTPDTIRYYERRGLLPEPSRTPSGYRVYEPEDVGRLEFVRKARALGLTLADVAEVLSLVEDGHEPCDHVRERLVSRLKETRTRMRKLRLLEARLTEALERAEELADSDDACRCPIIEVPPRG